MNCSKFTFFGEFGQAGVVNISPHRPPGSALPFPVPISSELPCWIPLWYLLYVFTGYHGSSLHENHSDPTNSSGSGFSFHANHLLNHLISLISVCPELFKKFFFSSMSYLQMYWFSLNNQNFIIIKVSSQHCHKNRYKHATELREVNPYIYGQLTFDNGVKKIQWRKNRLFLHMKLGKLYSHMQKR